MELTYGEAIREALHTELEQNQNMVMLGEDIQHNLYGYTENLMDTFSTARIINTPLSEAAVMGTGIGAAMRGMRVVIDLTVSNFLYVAMDQIVNMAAKTIYMYDGQFKLPLTIMCSNMYNSSNGTQHSDRSHPMFMNVPGLKISVPSNPQDAYTLLREAINDDSPVMYFTDRSLFYGKENVDINLSSYFGSASVKTTGDDITIVAISGAVPKVLSTAEELKRNGISSDVIDVRTLVPLDKQAILNSVNKTGRVLIVDTAHKTASAASEISSIIAEEMFHALKAPIGIIAYEDVPIPFAKTLEEQLMPTEDKILRKALEIFNYKKKI